MCIRDSCTSLFSVVQRETEVLQLARQLRAQSQRRSQRRPSQSPASVIPEVSFIPSSTDTVAQESSDNKTEADPTQGQGEPARGDVGYVQHCTPEDKIEASPVVHPCFT